jgi:hypothetical protein
MVSAESTGSAIAKLHLRAARTGGSENSITLRFLAANL